VAKGGPGLAFCTYPTTIMLLPFGASIFGIIFFLMLLTLGIDSAFSLVEAAVAGLQDKWKISRIWLNTIVCVAALALGILFTTRAGLYWLDIVDHHLTNFGLAVVGLFMCIVVGYVFKAKKLREYVNEVSEFKLGKWWDFFITVLTPVVLMVLIVLKVVERIQIPYEGYPGWSLLVGGWLVVVASLEIAFLLGGQYKKALYVLILAAFIGVLFLLEPWIAMMVVGFVVLLGGLTYGFYRIVRHSDSDHSPST
jgi:NSS family neurotransmitter:Na+ symporter